MKKNETFFQRVYQVTREIPPGKVTSYGAIAKFLGSGRSARMVGWAMNGSFRIKPLVPAHRVVNRNGMLRGKHHFPTPTAMQEMLEAENIPVKDDQITCFDKYFWDPYDHLNPKDFD